MTDPWLLYPVLFLAALFAGTVDTVAGGGGLVTVPLLMSLGWSPLEALGTNKFQSSFGSGSATYHFAKAGAFTGREVDWGVLWTTAGAAAGTVTVGLLSPDFLQRAIPFLLVTLALYFALTPRLGAETRPPRMGDAAFHLLFGLGIGFYDGFFGPGTGSFWAAAFVLLLGLDLKRATARTKVMNFTSNAVSLAVFLTMGAVHFLPGTVMAVGQFLGGRIGAKLVLTRGAKLVRPVLITAVLALAAKMVWSAYFP